MKDELKPTHFLNSIASRKVGKIDFIDHFYMKIRMITEVSRDLAMISLHD